MIGIIILPLSMVFILFFSGVKTAFIKADQLRLELDRKNEATGSGIISLFIQDSSAFIVAMLTGSMTSIAIFAISFYKYLTPLMAGITGSAIMLIIINIVILSFIIILIAEILPAMIFEKAPNTYLKALAAPALFFFIILYPVAKLLLAIPGLFLGSSPITGLKRDEPVIKSDYLIQHNNNDDSVSEIAGNDRHNIKIFRNLLDLSEMMVKEIMVPRTEIEAVAINGTVEQLREKFINTRYARILVYQDTIDNIAGYFEVKDLFRNPDDIKSSLRKLVIVPETMTANRLLKLFVAEKKNIAVVVDEFGGTSGMITIEDLLEEIVGDIEDEHDTNDLVERVKNDNEYILSGRLEIDYLNEKYGLNLPETDDYATLAGMVLFYNGSIPGNNDIIRIGNNITIKILRASATRIELVRLLIEK
ncbi:MAG TPA: hemolysin family protein [Bacteroidales bacterium]|nr:hemolysin family protein [Bacteroidales bacterium]